MYPFPTTPSYARGAAANSLPQSGNFHPPLRCSSVRLRSLLRSLRYARAAFHEETINWIWCRVTRVRFRSTFHRANPGSSYALPNSRRYVSFMSTSETERRARQSRRKFVGESLNFQTSGRSLYYMFSQNDSMILSVKVSVEKGKEIMKDKRNCFNR